MSKRAKKLLLSSLVLMAIPAVGAYADELGEWTPRTVDQIKADIQEEGQTATYTVKYGDTLGTISQALSVDVNALAEINSIADINVIYPGTILTTTYNQKHQATSLTVEAPTSNVTNSEKVKAKANLDTNAVTVNNQETSPASANQASAPMSDEQVEETAVASDSQVSLQSSEAPTASASSESAAPSVNQTTASSEEIYQTTTSKSETAEQTSEEVASTEQTTSASSEISPSSSAISQSETAEMATQVATSQSESVNTSEVEPQISTSEVSEITSPSVESQDSNENAQKTSTTNQAQTTVPTTPNDGLTPHAIEVKNHLANQFGISNIGGYRPGDQDHGKGTALDVMISSADEGHAVAQYVQNNFESLGVDYIIWQQKFYAKYDNIYGAANTWGQMPDRGSLTANHYDHVHISLNH